MQAAERHNFLSEIFYRAAYEIYRVIYDKEAVQSAGRAALCQIPGSTGGNVIFFHKGNG